MRTAKKKKREEEEETTTTTTTITITTTTTRTTAAGTTTTQTFTSQRTQVHGNEEKRKRKRKRERDAIISQYRRIRMRFMPSAQGNLLHLHHVPADDIDPYSYDIHHHLRSMEMDSSKLPRSNYMETMQREVTPEMRSSLIDHLVAMGEKYGVHSDTLHLAVSYIDRFLSCCNIDEEKLYLLGAFCMHIASKYQQSVPDFCLSSETLSREEIEEKEIAILKGLNFEMGSPTPKAFLWRYMCVAEDNVDFPSLELDFMCNYLVELSLLDHGCLRFPPSLIAASAVFLARFTLYPHIYSWNFDLKCCTGYGASDLKECVDTIHQIQLGNRYSHLRVIRDKYRRERFKCVATLSSPSEIPPCFFDDLM